MNKKNQLFGGLAAAAVLAVAAACGSTQGTSSALAGTTSDDGSANSAHLTEFDVSDTKSQVIDPALAQAIALDQKNEQQRLAQQGANATRPSVSSPGGTSAAGGPALVP